MWENLQERDHTLIASHDLSDVSVGLHFLCQRICLYHFRTACHLAPTTGFCYHTKEDRALCAEKEKGHRTDTLRRWCHSHSYSQLQEGNVLLICSITSVRSVLVSWGGASRSSDAVTKDRKSRELEIIAHPSSKEPRAGSNTATSPQNINGIWILIEKNNFRGN